MTAEQEQEIRKDERAKVVEEILEIIRGHSIESVGGWGCLSDDEKKKETAMSLEDRIKRIKPGHCLVIFRTHKIYCYKKEWQASATAFIADWGLCAESDEPFAAVKAALDEKYGG